MAARTISVLLVDSAMLKPLVKMFRSPVVKETVKDVEIALLTVEAAERLRLRVAAPAWLCNVSCDTVKVLESTVSSKVRVSTPVFMFRANPARLGASESPVHPAACSPVVTATNGFEFMSAAEPV